MSTYLKSPLLRIMLAATLLTLGLFLTASLPFQTMDADQISARAWLQDRSDANDLRSVQGKTFTPFVGPLFTGNDARPLWLKLRLAPTTQSETVLVIQPTYTHRAEVWHPEADGQWHVQVTGSALAYDQRPLKLLMPAVVVPRESGQPLTLYVRALTPTVPLYVRAMTREQAHAFNDRMLLSSGLVLGVALIMLLLSWSVCVTLRDPIWGLDALLNATGMGFVCLQYGLVSAYMLPSSENVVNQVMLVFNVLYGAVSQLLNLRLFRSFQIPSWVYRPHQVVLLAAPVLWLLIVTGHGDLAMRFNNLSYLLLTLWGVMIVVRARHEDTILRFIFSGSYLVSITAVIYWSLPMVLPMQALSMSRLYPNLALGMSTMILTALTLIRLTQLRLLAAQQAAVEKLAAERSLQAERQRHAETNSFLGMVLHEVKSPLHYIRLATSNLETELSGHGEPVMRRLRGIQTSVDNVDTVLERSIEVDSMEHGVLQLELTELNVAALVASHLSAHPAGIRLNASLPPVLVARVDPELLRLMLRNLLDNAVKYALPDSVIRVVMQREDRQWTLSVRNLVGQIGFPDADQVFRKYYRSPLAMGGSGLGLGLYWVRGVCARLGGDARYHRDQDEVVFTLCLPI